MRVKTWSAALFCGMALALPVAAQDDEAPKESPPPQTEPKAASPETAPAKKGIEDPPLHRWGGWSVSLAAWDPSLLGADEELAATYRNSLASPVLAGSHARIKEIIDVAYHLPHDAGSIVAHYEAMNHEDAFRYFTPGSFNFAETRAFPDSLGVFDDGFADGIEGSTLRKTHEFRLEYQKRAFETKWARGTWGIGYRQLSHNRALGTDYFALVPNLPPILPPAVNANLDPLRLQPAPDTVSQASGFTGHGLGASLNFEFPVHPRVSVISGLAIGLVRGRASSQYVSTSSYYFTAISRDVPLTKDQLFAILSSGSNDDIAAVEQLTVVHGANQPATSQVAQMYDVYVGVQVAAYRGLRVFGTVRDVYYANVGEYVVEKPGPAIARTSLSAGYEGYVIGLSWRF